MVTAIAKKCTIPQGTQKQLETIPVLPEPQAMVRANCRISRKNRMTGVIRSPVRPVWGWIHLKSQSFGIFRARLGRHLAGRVTCAALVGP